MAGKVLGGVKSVGRLAKVTGQDWLDDRAPTLAAALAFYTIFAIAPLLLIAIAVAGAVFGERVAQEEVFRQLQSLMGGSAAEMVRDVLRNAHRSGHGTLAVAMSIVTVVIGATGVFGQLQYALNRVWEVKVRPGSGLRNFVRKRLMSFVLVVGAGGLLLASLVASAGLAALRSYAPDWLPGSAILWQVLDLSIFMAMATLMFAAIFKVLPDAVVQWRDVWVGALVTAALFMVGRFLISFYVGRTSTASAYGAAGSLVILLVWVYYSSMIVLLGAEFTQAYVRWRGNRIVPEPHATRLAEA